jgi:hypothetical protein
MCSQPVFYFLFKLLVNTFAVKQTIFLNKPGNYTDETLMMVFSPDLQLNVYRYYTRTMLV